jgi:hypothetical protein
VVAGAQPDGQPRRGEEMDVTIIAGYGSAVKVIA